MKLSKILLVLLTIYVSLKCGEFALTDLIYSIVYNPFSWDSILGLLSITVTCFGLITLIYHYKTFFVLIHIEKNLETPFEPLIPKIYWNGAKGFTISLIGLIIGAIGFNIQEGSLGASILPLFLFIGIITWMRFDILKTESIYKVAIRPNESALNEIGHEQKD